MQAKSQSEGVSGFVSQATSEGAITYVEYSYARNAQFPVAKILNKANYYVEPTAGNVAVALLNAKIHPDLTQDLTQVYVDSDPRAYPMSSYSYMIIPKDTSPAGHFDVDKGTNALRLRRLLPLRGAAAGDHPGLLAAADQPGAGWRQSGQPDPRLDQET